VPEPEIEPTDAVTVELPTATAVAKPVLLTVATLAADEFQTAVLLTSCVLLSVNVPVAVNCWVIPAGTVALAGITAIELKAAALTVRAAEPDIKAEVAETVTLPNATLLASPLLSIEAMVGSVEFQFTGDRVCVLPSVNAPIAVKAVTVIGTRIGVTVKVLDPVIPLRVAQMLALPLATPVARPAPPTVETPAVAEDHVTCPVILGWGAVVICAGGSELLGSIHWKRLARRGYGNRNQCGAHHWRSGSATAATTCETDDK